MENTYSEISERLISERFEQLKSVCEHFKILLRAYDGFELNVDGTLGFEDSGFNFISLIPDNKVETGGASLGNTG